MKIKGIDLAENPTAYVDLRRRYDLKHFRELLKEQLLMGGQFNKSTDPDAIEKQINDAALKYIEEVAEACIIAKITDVPKYEVSNTRTLNQWVKWVEETANSSPLYLTNPIVGKFKAFEERASTTTSNEKLRDIIVAMSPGTIPNPHMFNQEVFSMNDFFALSLYAKPVQVFVTEVKRPLLNAVFYCGLRPSLLKDLNV